MATATVPKVTYSYVGKIVIQLAVSTVYYSIFTTTGIRGRTIDDETRRGSFFVVGSIPWLGTGEYPNPSSTVDIFSLRHISGQLGLTTSVDFSWVPHIFFVDFGGRCFAGGLSYFSRVMALFAAAFRSFLVGR